MYKKVSVIASAALWVLLPKCNACLMAYAGLFSAFGVGQFINHPYALTVIEVMLAINVAASLYLAVKEKQFLYAGISFVCSLVFIINKLYIDSRVVTVIASIVLLAAAIRIRLLRINKKECLFKQEIKLGC